MTMLALVLVVVSLASVVTAYWAWSGLADLRAELADLREDREWMRRRLQARREAEEKLFAFAEDVLGTSLSPWQKSVLANLPHPAQRTRDVP